MFETFGHPACVLLEGEAEDADLLVRHRVEQRLHDAPREPLHHIIFYSLFEIHKKNLVGNKMI